MNKKLYKLTSVLILLMMLLPSGTYANLAQNDAVSDVPAIEQQNETGLQHRVNAKAVREITEKRTRNAKHYLMDDGTIQAVIYSGDVHYEDMNGNFQEIRTSLVDEADLADLHVPMSRKTGADIQAMAKGNLMQRQATRIDRSKTHFRAVQVPFDVNIPKQFTEGYSIANDGDQLTFVPVGANSVTGSVYGEDTILYGEAWQNTDVELKLVSNGLKETIIAKNSDSPTTYSFEVRGALEENLRAGSLQLQPAWLEDANGVKRDVRQELRQEDGLTMLDLVVGDMSDLVFPVRIDPTIKINDLSTQDSYISDQYNSDINYGSNTRLHVHRGTIPNNEERSLIKFDISSLPSAETIQINSAKMQLFEGPNLTEDYDVVYLVTSSWAESTVTWNNQPNYNSNIYSDNATVSDSKASWDIKSILEMWINGTANYGVLIKGSSLATVSHDYASSEQYGLNNYYKPALTIDYSFNPSKPTLLTPNGSESIDSNYSITWLAATDQESTQSSLKYQVQLSTNGGSSWSDLLALSSAGQTSVTYDFSGTPATSNALIRVRAYDGVGYGPWDQSNALFEIRHNQAPNAPTNTYPGGGTAGTAVIVPSTTLTFNWNFNDADSSDAQSEFRVAINHTDNSVLLNSGWITSSISSYTVPSSHLNRGSTYYWNVQTKDQQGAASPASANRYIKINQLPTLNLTSYTDGQSVPDNLLTFTWSYTDADGHAQTKYQVQGSTDNWSTIAYNSGEIVSAAATHTSAFAQGEWDFRVRVFDGYEWSGWVSRNNMTLPNSFEPNESSTEAFGIQYDQSYSTLISSAADVDFYSFTAQKTGIDRIQLTVPSGLNYDLYIYDSNMKLLATGAKLTGDEDLLLYVQNGQTYFVKVFGPNGNSGSNPYTLLLTQFGIVNPNFQTTYQYDDNGNLTNKQTTAE